MNIRAAWWNGAAWVNCHIRAFSSCTAANVLVVPPMQMRVVFTLDKDPARLLRVAHLHSDRDATVPAFRVR